MCIAWPRAAQETPWEAAYEGRLISEKATRKTSVCG